MTERCLVVGGGPAGMMLGYLLASADCPVTVLESRQDFDRDFRGDSLHPYTLDLLGQLGLADRLLALPHHKARSFFFPANPVRDHHRGRLWVAPRTVQLCGTDAAGAVPDLHGRRGCETTGVRDPDGRQGHRPGEHRQPDHRSAISRQRQAYT